MLPKIFRDQQSYLAGLVLCDLVLRVLLAVLALAIGPSGFWNVDLESRVSGVSTSASHEGVHFNSEVVVVGVSSEPNRVVEEADGWCEAD
jgi:hypothetical protein